jgi:hypothetical protein
LLKLLNDVMLLIQNLCFWVVTLWIRICKCTRVNSKVIVNFRQ